MAKRMILMLAITATLIGALGFAKFRQIQEGMAQAAAFQPPPEAVTTIVAKQSKWPDTLSAIGTIAAVQGVTVSADLPGIVERIDFESGASVLAGRHSGSIGYETRTGTVGGRRIRPRTLRA